MSPGVRRRKNQKKMKRRKRKRCSLCGGRAECSLKQVGMAHRLNPETPVKICYDCGAIVIMPWGAGGVIGRRIPSGDFVIVRERCNDRAGSTPALFHLDSFGGIE